MRCKKMLMKKNVKPSVTLHRNVLHMNYLKDAGSIRMIKTSKVTVQMELNAG